MRMSVPDSAKLLVDDDLAVLNMMEVMDGCDPEYEKEVGVAQERLQKLGSEFWSK